MPFEATLDDLWNALQEVKADVKALLAKGGAEATQQKLEAAGADPKAPLTEEEALALARQTPNLSVEVGDGEIKFTRKTPFGPQRWTRPLKES